MINKIILFSVRQKFIIGLLTLALIGVGIYCMSTVNLGSVPDITNNQVQVITVSPNLATEDIEQFVTYPVELAMGNLPGVEEIRSISRFGLSVVTIVFEDKMGTYLPRQLVQEKLKELQETIPEKFGSPSMGPISTGLGQIYEYTIEPQAGYDTVYSPMDLRTIQDWMVKRQLTLLEGVVEVNSFGGYIKQYEVAINPEKLNAMNVSISEVYEALARNNVNTGGAYIEKNRMANFIRGEGLLRSLKDIENIVIRNENGLPILIRDVAEKVHFGHQVRYGAFTQDGHEAVGGIIMMLKGANPNAVVQNVIRRMQEIEKSLPEGLAFNTYIDRSALIHRTTSTLIKNLTEGALIVVFVLVLLLGSVRGGIITASVIPLSLLFAFILMKVTGVWANLMSLGAIDFGIIVDGAVIIVEGTVHEIEKRIKGGKRNFGRAQMDEIAYKSGSTMMNAAFFGQLIILIVFAPILFLTGVEGKMFRPMAFTFGYAVLGAIILCLTYVPMVSALLMKPVDKGSNWFARFEHAIHRLSEKIIITLNKAYQPLIKKALQVRALVIAVALVLLAVAAYIFSSMGGEFVPQLDEGDLAMQALIRPGSSLSESKAVSIKIENLLLQNFPEIKTVTARIGVADIPTDPMPMDIADMYLILEKDKRKWVSATSKDELIQKIKGILAAHLTGVNLVFTQPVELRFNELLEGVREDIAVKLYGEDLEVLSAKAQEMAEIIRTVPGAEDVSPERTTGLPQMTVRYNRAKVAQYGLDIQKLNGYVSAAFAGGVAGVIFEGEKRFDLVIRFDEQHRRSIEDLRTLYIDLPDGTQVPIKEVADISYVPGPMQISRDNTYRRTYVGVNVRGRDVESVVNDIRERLESRLDLPPGYYITYGGAFENLQRAKSRLMIVVPIALFLIFILLYFALNSFSQSIMIYMAIPLAAIGGVFFLALRGMPFSISAGVGFIVLFGVAVLNGLVLISRFNSLKAEGMTSLKKRIYTGTSERLRPILLTATAAIMGFTPMAFSVSAGAEVQRPLATVVIGGLISATLLTLVVLPVLYSIVEERSGSKGRANVSNTIKAIGVLLWAGLLGLPSSGYAQQDEMPMDKLPVLTLEQARKRAVESYPNIKAAQLQVEKQQALKGTARNMGNTQIFTGGEELGKANGIYNLIGIQQSQIDAFGIKPKLQLQNEQSILAEKAFVLSVADLELEVSRAWADVYRTKNIYRLYQHLDSVFTDIQRAASIRLETQASSRLAYLAASNQAHQVHIQKQQAYHNYQIALQRLNRWLVNDTLYSVPDIPPGQLLLPIDEGTSLPLNHPLLDVFRQQVVVAEADMLAKRSELRPKPFFQYGVQSVGGQLGFHQFQVGVQLPVFSRPQKARLQAAKIQKDIARQNLLQVQAELNANYQSAREQYLKWQNSWFYYRDNALPLAREQQAGAIIAYREGAMEYVSFLQSIRDAVRIQIDAWDAFGSYLESRFQLEYFLSPSN